MGARGGPPCDTAVHHRLNALNAQVLEPSKQAEYRSSPQLLSHLSSIMTEQKKKKKEKKTSIKDIEPKLRETKEPLTHGSNYGKERTWLDTLGGPIILLILCLLTFQLFLYVRPHIGNHEQRPIVHSRIPDTVHHIVPDKEPPLKPVEVKPEEPSGEF
jgi:hypothetical protein